MRNVYCNETYFNRSKPILNLIFYLVDYKLFVTTKERCQNRCTNKTYLTFTFLTVEESPLLGHPKSTILTILGIIILFVGLVIQARIYVMLKKQKRDGTVVVIDRIFKTYNIVNTLCQPLFIVYWIASFSLFPMVDYIGQPGCIVFSLWLQVFISIYCLVFPLTITVVRYVLVVHSSWAKKIGVNKLVNIIVALSIIIPGVIFIINFL